MKVSGWEQTTNVPEPKMQFWPEITHPRLPLDTNSLPDLDWESTFFSYPEKFSFRKALAGHQKMKNASLLTRFLILESWNYFCNQNSCSTLRTIMRVKLPYSFLLSVFMMFWSVSMTAQSHSLPQPQMSEIKSSSIPPPPPGLPIDENMYVLIIAGLGLGIYLLRTKKPV